MSVLNIKCWCCGKETAVEGSVPQLGVHLMEAARVAGFMSIVDLYSGRVLVFCSEDCLKKCTTKKGTIRMRPPKVAKRNDVLKETE